VLKLTYLSNVSRVLHQRLKTETRKKLAELLGLSAREFKLEREPSVPGRAGEVDMVAHAGDFIFVVQCKTKGEAASTAMAANQAKKFAAHFKKKSIPLVAVPYMGEVGRRVCEEAQVSWLDLSGNAHLFGPPGLRVHIEGKPNLFKRPGRPRSVFAPKSARLARCLLTEPDHAMTQRELANASGLDEGFTSRIVRQLEAEHLVERQPNGAVKVADLNALLEAWREAYDFSRHHIVRGHIAARSSDEVLRRLAGSLKRGRVEHAATGLAGAWLLNQFAGFRLVVFYVAQLPSAEAQQTMGFREESRGENVWLVVPNDEGVFHGATEHGGIRCVHPVQVYLDLKDHPERSAEAAEQLRRDILRKGGNA
jgi:DNA-binding MarR family transcriptional regulator